MKWLNGPQGIGATPVGGDPLRFSRIRRNDIRFEGAALEMLIEVSWERLSVRALSSRAGLTPGAFYGRFEHLADVAPWLWDGRLGESLCEPLTSAIGAVSDGDEDRFMESLARLASPTPEVLGAAELLQAALFDEQLGRLIGPRFRAFLEPHASVKHNDDVQAAVAATVIFLGLGLVLLSGRSWASGDDLESEFSRYFLALQNPVAPRPTPDNVIAEYIYQYPFETGDERLDRLLHAAATSIGNVGFHAATVQMICRVAAVSPGFMMSRFPTKLDVFLAIVEMMWGHGLAQINGFIAEAAGDLGPGMAEAVAWREMQNPVIANIASLAVETNRMVAFIPELKALVEEEERRIFVTLPSGHLTSFVHSEFALGNGMVLASRFQPEIHKLPFFCVTEPLVASAPNI